MTRRGNLGISVRVPLYEMSTRWTRGVCLQMGVCIHRSSCVDVKKVRSADVELGEIAGWTLKCAWQDFKMDRRPCSCAVPWTGQILMKQLTCSQYVCCGSSVTYFFSTSVATPLSLLFFYFSLINVDSSTLLDQRV